MGFPLVLESVMPGLKETHLADRAKFMVHS